MQNGGLDPAVPLDVRSRERSGLPLTGRPDTVGQDAEHGHHHRLVEINRLRAAARMG